MLSGFKHGRARDRQAAGPTPGTPHRYWNLISNIFPPLTPLIQKDLKLTVCVCHFTPENNYRMG